MGRATKVQPKTVDLKLSCSRNYPKSSFSDLILFLRDTIARRIERWIERGGGRYQNAIQACMLREKGIKTARYSAILRT